MPNRERRVFDQVPKLVRDFRTLFHKIQQGLKVMSVRIFASQESQPSLQQFSAPC